MKKTTIVLTALLVLIIVFTRCEKKKLPLLQSDPVTMIGHGSILGGDGKELQLTAVTIMQMQNYYISMLSSEKLAMREGGVYDAAKMNKSKEQIYGIVSDEILANALYLDWLIEERKPDDGGRYEVITSSLRWYYVLEILKKGQPDKDGRWTKGIPEDQAKEAEAVGFQTAAITNANMPAYCQECADAGVPVPEKMFGPEWEALGSFDGEEFISPSFDPQLMIKVSTEPPGFCLALPRYTSSNQAALFGVICMSTITSRVCFFDNKPGLNHTKDVQINFQEGFIGGIDLKSNEMFGGVCTDCHAGENPYIVHPEKAAFDAFLTRVDGNDMPPRWYVPIAPGTWPQNPGPSYILDAISSPGQCNSCHNQSGSGGRFPRVTYPLPGYCSDILGNAIRSSGSGGTMPPSYAAGPDYSAHANALVAACGETKDQGTVVTIPTPGNNTSFISPPTVIGPLYGCATAVSVRGVVLGAKATLRINGVDVGSIDDARNTTQLEFAGLAELNVGDVVTAIQSIDANSSAPSPGERVRDFREDYPTGLPAPTIDPATIYACADVIAVRHVSGAKLTVYTNGANPVSRGTSTGYSGIRPSGAPFAVGMKFTAEITLCGETSPMSAPVLATAYIGTPPIPEFDPLTVYEGQEIVHVQSIIRGAKVGLQLTSVPWNTTFSTPNTGIDYDMARALGRPMGGADHLQASQSLCSSSSEWSRPNEKLHDCGRLPAARIDPPIAGATYVTVYEFIPGSRIMIYDNSGNEIGDGSGTVVNLSRPIAVGERLNVTQRLGECTSTFVFSITAGS